MLHIVDLLGGAVLALVLVASAATAWEAEWIRGEQPANQKDFMDLNVLRELRRAAVPEVTKTPLPWYTVADLSNPRLEPLCAMTVMHAKAGQWKINWCSCAFVKPDLVAAAAHCLVEAKVTPKSEHAIWVQQLYGKGNDPDFDKYPVNMVSEWWYPSAYLDVGESITHDVAFFKTKEKGTKAYKMLMPIDLSLGPANYNVEADNVWMIGYPSDAARQQVAVISSGFLRTRENHRAVVENAYGAGSKTKRPQMNGGGSGGPIIVSDATLDAYKEKGWKESAEAIRMGLFAVTGLASNLPPYNEMFATKFTAKLLKAVDAIASKGTKGAVVQKRDNGEQLVKLQGI